MRQLGSRYTLEQIIGRGATGEVWRAHDTAGETVAVKVLRPDLVDDAEVVARFVRERNLLRSVHSPHVVTVRDLVIEGTTLAIVMEYAPRADLRAFMRDNGGVLTPAQAVAVTCQILDALDTVHAAGIVHRDVKPENVLVDLDAAGAPVAKLSDFGVSRLLDGVTLTRVTGLVGTPRYMAPELGAGDDPSPSSDLYATGIVLYELLTGRVPFTGEHPIAMLRAHTEEPPPRPRGIDPQLWKVLAKLLAKKPAARYADARAALRALDDVAPRLDGARPLTDPRTNDTIHTSGGKHSDRPSPVSMSSFRGYTSLPRRPGAPRWQHPRVMFGSASFAVLALVAGLFALSSGGGSATATGERAWVDTYKTSGFAVWRDWRLAGTHGDTFEATETVMPISRTLAQSAQYTLVVPKSLAKHARDVLGVAGTVVEADPVISVPLGALATTTAKKISYTIRVPGRGRKSSRLDAWNGDMLRARRAFERVAPAHGVSGEVPVTKSSAPEPTIGAQHAAAFEAFTGQAPPSAVVRQKIIVVSSAPGTGPTTGPGPSPTPGPGATPGPGPTPVSVTALSLDPARQLTIDAGASQVVTITGQTNVGTASSSLLAASQVVPGDGTVSVTTAAPGPPGSATFTVTGVSPGSTTVAVSNGSGSASLDVQVNDVPPPPPTILGATWNSACSDLCTLTVTISPPATHGTYPIGGYDVFFGTAKGILAANATTLTLNVDASGNITGTISGGIVDMATWPQQLKIGSHDTANFGSVQQATYDVPAPPPFTPTTQSTATGTGTTPTS